MKLGWPLVNRMRSFAFPPPLEPGDLISVVAPSSPFPAGAALTRARLAAGSLRHRREDEPPRPYGVPRRRRPISRPSTERSDDVTGREGGGDRPRRIRRDPHPARPPLGRALPGAALGRRVQRRDRAARRAVGAGDRLGSCAERDRARGLRSVDPWLLAACARASACAGGVARPTRPSRGGRRGAARRRQPGARRGDGRGRQVEPAGRRRARAGGRVRAALSARPDAHVAAPWRTPGARSRESFSGSLRSATRERTASSPPRCSPSERAISESLSSRGRPSATGRETTPSPWVQGRGSTAPASPWAESTSAGEAEGGTKPWAEVCRPARSGPPPRRSGPPRLQARRPR